MIPSMQLERLEKDSSQLDLFIQELTEKGKTELADKIRAKKEFLDNHIRELSN